MRALAFLLSVVLAPLACSSWQRVGAEDLPPPGTSVPRLFQAAPTYRSMGLLVAGPPLPFVASLRYLDGGPDSTLAIVAVSLANQALRFRRDGEEFVARYRVDLLIRPDSGPPRSVTREESVRVRGFQETLRADESVIFQQLLRLIPGRYLVSIAVRDVAGPALNRAERADTVPAFTRPGLGDPVPYYEGTGRRRSRDLPRLVSNPRATLPYAGDSLRVYLEGYGITAPTPLTVRVLDAAGTVLHEDTMQLTPPDSGDIAWLSYVLAPASLPVGRLDLTASLPAGPTVEMPFLLSFSGQYVVTNYEEMVSLLRYFDRQEEVAKLRDAPPAERSERWDAFWRATDPVPITPENEALESYFQRVQQANVRFAEEGAPGWLTDRGEVFITLGEPDDVIDQSSSMDRSGRRIIRWSYTTLRLVVFFEDETGFGRFRLDPNSRAEYQRVLARVRRGQ